MLESQKNELSKEKYSYLNSLIEKIKNNKDSENNDLEKFSEDKGYKRFGNYLINDIVNDFIYILEDYLIKIENKIMKLNPHVLSLYLKFQSMTLEKESHELFSDEIKDFIWVKNCGDSFITDKNESSCIKLLEELVSTEITPQLIKEIFNNSFAKKMEDSFIKVSVLERKNSESLEDKQYKYRKYLQELNIYSNNFIVDNVVDSKAEEINFDIYLQNQSQSIIIK